MAKRWVWCAGACGEKVRREGRFCRGCLDAVADIVLERARCWLDGAVVDGTQLTTDVLQRAMAKEMAAWSRVRVKGLAS